MDFELALALVILWSTTTSCLIFFFLLWFATSDSFHPHSVDITDIHNNFYCVSSPTVCKYDCAVKSISSYVAPRGSTSSKYFTVLCTIVAVSGALGSYRWYKVGDATYIESYLAIIGFLSLLLVGGFELDVSSKEFLNDKLIASSWIAKRIQNRGLTTPLKLPFSLEAENIGFQTFLYTDPMLSSLYNEAQILYPELSSSGSSGSGGSDGSGNTTTPPLHTLVEKKQQNWSFLHMLGSVLYILLVTGSIVIHEKSELRVGWITGICFFLFCFLSYLSGNYITTLPLLQANVLLWNPFVAEPEFVEKLYSSLWRVSLDSGGDGDGVSGSGGEGVSGSVMSGGEWGGVGRKVV